MKTFAHLNQKFKEKLSKMKGKSSLRGVVRVLLLIFFIVTSFQARSQKQNEEYCFQFEQRFFVDSLHMPGMRVINTSDTSLSFRFSINDRFWFTPAEMVAYIIDMKTDSLPFTNTFISNAFHFVVMYSSHRNEISLKNENGFSPGTFINSLGYGICSNRSAVLANILLRLGFESRCINLGGHVVCEVFDNHKWKMLDPDNNIYFIRKNEIASVSEIEQDYSNCKTVFGKNTMNFFNTLMPQKYASFYADPDNNIVETWDVENINWETSCMTLPPGAELEFPADNPNVDSNTVNLFACLKLQSPFMGRLNIPFVIQSTKGRGFMYNLQDTVPSTAGAFKEFCAPGNYYVMADSINIYFYINPFLLPEKRDSSTIILYSNKSSGLQLIAKPNLKKEAPYVWLKKYEKILELKTPYYKDILSSSDPFFNDTISMISAKDFTSAFTDFYSKTHNTKKVPDSINNKLKHTLMVLKRLDLNEDVFFNKFKFPFFRSIIMIIIVELPEKAIDETFDFFKSKFRKSKD